MALNWSTIQVPRRDYNQSHNNTRDVLSVFSIELSNRLLSGCQQAHDPMNLDHGIIFVGTPVQFHQLVHADAFPDQSSSIPRLYPRVQPPEPRKMTSISAVGVREHTHSTDKEWSGGT